MSTLQNLTLSQLSPHELWTLIYCPSESSKMIHLEKDGKQLLVTSIVFLVLDTVAVVLRLVAKSRTKFRFAYDDLWIIVTVVVFAAWAGLVIGSKETVAP